MSSPVIQLEVATKAYQRGKVEVRALDGVDLTIDHGELVAVMGPSDSGKSALVGESFEAGEPFGSVKAVSEVFAPVTGQVIKVNEGLSGSPECINQEPYGKGWLIEVRMTNPAEAGELLTAAEYEAHAQSKKDS